MIQCDALSVWPQVLEPGSEAHAAMETLFATLDAGISRNISWDEFIRAVKDQRDSRETEEEAPQSSPSLPSRSIQLLEEVPTPPPRSETPPTADDRDVSFVKALGGQDRDVMSPDVMSGQGLRPNANLMSRLQARVEHLAQAELAQQRQAANTVIDPLVLLHKNEASITQTLDETLEHIVHPDHATSVNSTPVTPTTGSKAGPPGGSATWKGAVKNFNPRIDFKTPSPSSSPSKRRPAATVAEEETVSLSSMNVFPKGKKSSPQKAVIHVRPLIF